MTLILGIVLFGTVPKPGMETWASFGKFFAICTYCVSVMMWWEDVKPLLKKEEKVTNG